MPTGSSGGRVRAPSRSTQTGTTAPLRVPGSTITTPCRVAPPGADHTAGTGTVASVTLSSPLMRAGDGASASTTARVRERSAASPAATACRWVAVRFAVPTASGGGGRDDRTTTSRPTSCSRAERRLSGPEPKVNRRNDRRRRVFFGALCVGGVICGLPVRCGCRRSDEGAPLQLLELRLVDRAAVQHLLGTGDLVQPVVSGGRDRPDVGVG